MTLHAPGFSSFVGQYGWSSRTNWVGFLRSLRFGTHPPYSVFFRILLLSSSAPPSVGCAASRSRDCFAFDYRAPFSFPLGPCFSVAHACRSLPLCIIPSDHRFWDHALRIDLPSPCLTYVPLLAPDLRISLCFHFFVFHLPMVGRSSALITSLEFEPSCFHCFLFRDLFLATLHAAYL